MHFNRLMILALVSATLTLEAQQPSNPLDASTEHKPLDWNDPKWWESLETKSPGIKLGKSDLILEGPLVRAFRPATSFSPRRSLRQKIRSLPFVNPVAAKSETVPLRGKDYFGWRDHNTPWSTLADRPIPGPQSVLISVHR